MSKRKKHNPLYVLLIASAIILFWRGAWGLMDMYIFPDHQFKSYVTSAVLGIIVLQIAHKLEDELL